MHVTPISIRPLLPPHADLFSVLREVCKDVPNQSVVAVSSKVVSIHQGRCVKIPEDHKEARELKEKLIREESEWYLERDRHFRHSRMFTIHEGLFGSSAGIDESNGNGYFILLPKEVNRTADGIRSILREQSNAAPDLGVVIVDSRFQIMRNGATGIALGHAGFDAVFDYRGKADIFGRILKAERVHVADSLACAASLVLGEANECTPIALITDIPHITFSDDTVNDPLLSSSVAMDADVCAQFLSSYTWQKGGRNMYHGKT